MKLTKYTFFMLGLTSSFSMLGTSDTFAKACDKKDISAGYYCEYGGTEYECREGCYCKGASKEKGTTEYSMSKHCANRWSGDLSKFGIYLCPATHPKSDRKAKDQTDCYYFSSVNSSKVYYAEVSCPAGQYLPRLTNKCVKCSESVYCLDCDKASPNARGYICTGTGGTVVTKDTDQGVKKCESGKNPNPAQTECVSSISVSSGYYLPKNWTTPKSCEEARREDPNFSLTYYCPGGNFAQDSTKDQGREMCLNGQIASADFKSCESTSIKHCNVGEYMPERGQDCAKCNFFMTCLGGDYKTNSYYAGADWGCSAVEVDPQDALVFINFFGAGTEDNLKVPALDGGPCEKMKDVTVKCEKGYYLPKMRRFCDQCPSGTACKGGTFHLSLREDQGLGEQCTDPEKPNHNTGKCSRDTVNCIKGTYLPANKTSSNDCKACPTGKICPGGDFEIPWDKDQGLLDKKEITVEPGYYLPKGSDETKKCTSTSKFCPGGKYEPSTSRDQGIVDCPKNSRANDAKTACTITLTKKQLMYGVNGTGGKYSENALQCWAKKGDDYKKCMGFTSDGSYKPTENTGTGKVFTGYKAYEEIDLSVQKPADMMQMNFGGFDK